MNYRPLGRTGLNVSEIGMGCEQIMELDSMSSAKILNAAVAAGINYFDLFSPHPQMRDAFGIAMEGQREKFILQAHLCSAWVDGQYKRTRKLDEVKSAFADLLSRLRTDYIDIGMIHYIDGKEDFDQVFGGPVLAYAKELKASETVHFLGLSTHNPKIAIMAAETGLIDVIMFSCNPAYDILPPSEDINTMFDPSSYEALNPLSHTDPERKELYSLCESRGVALTVMKPFAGGALLHSNSSPFGKAMTVAQCLHYCLTRPAVATVLSGAKDIKELHESVAYCQLSDEEKDYSTLLSSFPLRPFVDACMYCGHCAPGTVGIDIATVNKFADLCEAQGAVPDTVREHYAVMPAKASACVKCGQCEARCPFGVEIIKHMEKASTIFGS